MTRPVPARRKSSALIAPAIIASALLALLAGCGSEPNGGAAGAEADITVVHATLDVPPNPSLAAIRMEIVNGTEAADVLVGVSSPDGTATIHRSDVDAEGRSTMSPVDRLDVPARSTVVFEPGGLHVMLSDITRDLTAGDVVTLTLEFEDHGNVRADVAVVDPSDATGGASEHDHEAMPAPPPTTPIPTPHTSSTATAGATR